MGSMSLEGLKEAREMRRLETFDHLGRNYYGWNYDTGSPEIWHNFTSRKYGNQAYPCEYCGQPVKRGFMRMFSYHYEGKKYVSSEVAHAKCVRRLQKEALR